MARTTAQQGGMGVAQKRLRQGEYTVRADCGRVIAASGGQTAHGGNAHLGQQIERLIFHHIRQGTYQKQFFFLRLWQGGHHGCQAGIFPLGEGCFNTRTREVQHPHMGGMLHA